MRVAFGLFLIVACVVFVATELVLCIRRHWDVLVMLLFIGMAAGCAHARVIPEAHGQCIPATRIKQHALTGEVLAVDTVDMCERVRLTPSRTKSG